MEISSTVVYIICLIVIFILGKFFIVPIKLILKILINSILGAFLLYIINIIGSICGFHIGLNVFTSIVVGLLGIPGAILLAFFSFFIL